MTYDRAIEILDPAHREHYESIDPVNEECRMGMEALRFVRDFVYCKYCVKHGAYNCSCQFESAPPTPDDFFCADGRRKE